MSHTTSLSRLSRNRAASCLASRLAASATALALALALRASTRAAESVWRACKLKALSGSDAGVRSGVRVGGMHALGASRFGGVRSGRW